MKKFLSEWIALSMVLLLLLTALSGCITIVEFPEETDGGDSDASESEAEITPPESESESDRITDGEETSQETEPPTTESERTEPPTETPTESPTEAPTEPPTEAPTEAPTEPPTTPPETDAEPIDPPEPTEKIKIYVDQGHNPTGTHNAGAQGNGLCEENITFAVGVALAELLEADGRFEVRLSRPTAQTVLGTNNSESLAARSGDANAWGADYFVSIHVNSFTAETANGIEAFAYSDAGEGYLLGGEIVDALVAATGFAKRGMKVRTDLHVLKYTTMPATLVEIGFISNPTEAALMASDPALFAQGIYQGISAYFQD